jgi:hypothetical protein
MKPVPRAPTIAQLAKRKKPSGSTNAEPCLD